MRILVALSVLALALVSCSVRETSKEPVAAAPTGNASCCPAETTLAEFEGVATSCTLTAELVSDDGTLRACNYRMTGIEGGSTILFCGTGGVLGSFAYSRAVAWEPRGRRLLIRDAAADDDIRMFVLDVGAGEITIPPNDRLRRIIGERGDDYRGWEGDTLLLENYFTPGIRRVAIPPR